MGMLGSENGGGGDNDVSNFIPTPLDRVLALLFPVLNYKTCSVRRGA